MNAGAVATFVTIDVLLVLTPGPDWAYVVAVGLRDRMVVPAVAGLVAGYGALTVLVAVGLAALVATSPSALTAMTLAGGAYLIWLGADLALGTLARSLLAARPTAARTIALTSGIVMIVLGVLLVLERALGA